MTTIPVYKMEEHHEAFMIWNDAIEKKYLPQTGNSLLHVDQHSDMSKPFLRTPISKLEKNKEKIRRFTYDELKIGTFIYPAVYAGIFNTVYWLLQEDDISKPKPMEKYVISTYKNQGKKFQVNQARPTSKGSVTFMRRDLTIKEPLKVDQSLVLDIDLDYFSCSSYQNKPIKVEITKKQFGEFNKNKYHPLRFEYHCYTKKIADQYFMIFNQNEDIVIRPHSKVSNNQVSSRINTFVDWLQTNEISPNIIDVCRNTYSGYTPGAQREFIEDHLISKLKEIYSIKLHPMIP